MSSLTNFINTIHAHKITSKRRTIICASRNFSAERDPVRDSNSQPFGTAVTGSEATALTASSTKDSPLLCTRCDQKYVYMYILMAVLMNNIKIYYSYLSKFFMISNNIGLPSKRSTFDDVCLYIWTLSIRCKRSPSGSQVPSSTVFRVTTLRKSSMVTLYGNF